MRTERYDDAGLVGTVEDHGDGTATRITYDGDGNETDREQIAGLTAAQRQARADEAERLADATAIRYDFAELKTRRDDAGTVFQEMHPRDGLSRWAPLPEDGTASNADIAKRINRLIGGQRSIQGDLRFTLAALVRKLRKDRDDQP